MVKSFLVACMVCSCCFCVLPAYSAEEQVGEAGSFDSEQMLAEMEKKLQLTKEQLEKLKPVVSAKSVELQKSMHDSIDKGFVELEKLSKKLDALSNDAMTEMEDLLTGEEMVQLREYLGKIDKEGMNRVKDGLVEEFAALLELTEEQAVKIKPILEESFRELAEMLDRFSRQGASSLEEFKVQYDLLVKNLREKLQDLLNKKQMDSLDNHSEELKEKIQENVIAI